MNADLIPLLDLTTLNATDDTARIEAIARRALAPIPGSAPCAAVCVFPSGVPTARRVLPADGPVRLASVAGAFPHGHSPLSLRIAEVRWAVEAGADEVDIVLRRDLLLAGEDNAVLDGIAAQVAAAGSAHVKVILETGELEADEAIARASRIAIAAGASFLKTSTGKSRLASLAHGRVMLRAIAEHRTTTGRTVGFKAAGGISTIADARAWTELAAEIMGGDYVQAAFFRLGASRLLDAIAHDNLTNDAR